MHSQINNVLGGGFYNIKQQHYIAALKITLTLNHWPWLSFSNLPTLYPVTDNSHTDVYTGTVTASDQIRNMTNSHSDSQHQEERKVFSEHHGKGKGFQTVTAPTEEFSLNKEFV